jgi:hypothetical protein
VTDGAAIATLLVTIWAGIHIAGFPRMPDDGTILIR